MISTYRYKQLIWIDLESPTTEEVAHVVEEMPPIEARELFVLEATPTVSRQYGIVIETSHIPLFDGKTGRLLQLPFRFIRFGNTIVTLHNKHLPFLDHARYRLESANKSLTNAYSETTDFVYTLVLEEMVKLTTNEMKQCETYMHASVYNIKKSSRSTTMILSLVFIAIIIFILTL